MDLDSLKTRAIEVAEDTERVRNEAERRERIRANFAGQMEAREELYRWLNEIVDLANRSNNESLAIPLGKVDINDAPGGKSERTLYGVISRERTPATNTPSSIPDLPRWLRIDYYYSAEEGYEHDNNSGHVIFVKEDPGFRKIRASRFAHERFDIDKIDNPTDQLENSESVPVPTEAELDQLDYEQLAEILRLMEIERIQMGATLDMLSDGLSSMGDNTSS